MPIGWFVCVARPAGGLDRARLRAARSAHGIDSRPYFPPIHLQPLYRERFGFHAGMFPHAEAAGASLLALPFHAKLAMADVDRVCAAVAEELAHVAVIG